MPPRHRLILLLLIPLTAVGTVMLGAALAQPAAVSLDDFRLTDTAYLSAPNVQWLALISLAPLFIALAFAWRHERPVTEYLQPEMFSAFGCWVALVSGYAMAYSFPFIGVLPRFDEPANQIVQLSDVPVNFLALAPVAAVVAFFGWFIFRRVGGFGRIADRIVVPHRRTALLILLSMLAVMVWLFGGIVFAELMLIPAWLWVLIEARPTPSGKLVNVVFALGGAGSFAAFGVAAVRQISWWRIILFASYGVVSPIDVLLFLLVAALFIRFLRLGLSNPYVAPADPIGNFLYTD